MIQSFPYDGRLLGVLTGGSSASDEQSVALVDFEAILLELGLPPDTEKETTQDNPMTLESDSNFRAFMAAMIPAPPLLQAMQSDGSWSAVSGQEAGLERSTIALNSGSRNAALTERWIERNGWIFPNELNIPDLPPAFTSEQSIELPLNVEPVNSGEIIESAPNPQSAVFPAKIEASIQGREVEAVSVTLGEEMPAAVLDLTHPMGNQWGDQTHDFLSGNGEQAESGLGDERVTAVPEKSTHPIEQGTVISLTTRMPETRQANESNPMMAAEALPIFQQISEHLERMIVLPKENVAHLRLDPPELGTVQIAIQVNGAEVQAQFTANHEMTRRMLEQTVEQLRQMLEERGLQLGQMDVYQENASGQAFQQPSVRRQSEEAQNQPDYNNQRTETPSWNVWGRMGAWA